MTACQKGDVTHDLSVISEHMSFSVQAPGHMTKLTDNAFEALDAIGLYVTDYADDNTPMPLQVSGNHVNNMIMTFDGAVWTPEKTIYWGEGKSDVYAYYPYCSEISDVDSQYFEVAADQTSGGFEASDLLWAKSEGVESSGGAVSLQMKHIMSKLTVRIVAGEDYIGSLPEDVDVFLHSTVTGARVDLVRGSVSRDTYSGAKSIKMKKNGLRTYDGVDAIVFEAIVVPQMIETSVPLLEIKSKSISYLVEDPFNFRTGVSYTYTATLNASTTSIKVDIGCELEDWNSVGGDSGDGGDSGEGGAGEGEDNDSKYVDLSAAGTANCYLIQEAGDYKFRTVIGNSDATVGNVKSVEVLWESFGTDVRPNVGDLIASVSYKNGYVLFSTPENFRDGNAVIAVKNSNGTILWSWHIWCAGEGWTEQIYANDAGILMDRNLGATSATPGSVGAVGLMYQWGRKDPFMGGSSVNSYTYKEALSTGTWAQSSDNKVYDKTEANPMTLYTNNQSTLPTAWGYEKTTYDPCPPGWRVPGSPNGNVWVLAGLTRKFDSINKGILFESGVTPAAWYPAAGERYTNVNSSFGSKCFYWTCDHSPSGTLTYGRCLNMDSSNYFPNSAESPIHACSVRCQKEE